MMSVSLPHRRRRQTAALLGSDDPCQGAAAEKRVLSGERSAIEREMFIAAVPETVAGFLLDRALTGQWIAGSMGLSHVEP